MTVAHSFHDKIELAWQRSRSLLCVGLDPRLEQLPVPYEKDRDSVLEFCKTIVDATSEYACAFKPNHAFYAALGLENELADLIEYIHNRYPDTPVVLDAKRGDIDSTAEQYAVEAFERYNVDAVTVNPFLGWDTVEPFLAWKERGVFVLCRTSNRGSAWLQTQPDIDPVYEQIAERVDALNNPNVGLVVGATNLEELREIRDYAPDTLLLIPGVGIQGAKAADVLATGCADDGREVLINVSRGIMHQDETIDYLDSVSAKAREYAAEMTIDG